MIDGSPRGSLIQLNAITPQNIVTASIPVSTQLLVSSTPLPGPEAFAHPVSPAWDPSS